MTEKSTEHVISDVILPAPVPVPPPINIINFENYRINNNSWSNHEITEEDDEEEEEENDDVRNRTTRLMPSITEGYNEGYSNSSELFGYDSDRNVNDVVYVVTWRGSDELLSASMDALVWTIGSGVYGSGIVYLVHVFPELRFIPTPLGRLPISQANPEQKESYVSDERSKRAEYLQKFLSLCSSSKVQVETVLIESDMEAKAILDLIPILNIRKLVMGATKSNLRKLKSSSKKGGGGTLDQILHNAPHFCEVKVICDGKEVSLQDQLTNEPPGSPYSAAPSPRDTPLEPMQDHTNSFVRCGCFKL
ncbi:putative rossmann-like alpha/beta/alpha sandwich protein [Helianthus annuus]|uniref:Putative rossmann-like alpha/beta/alpha sandwich fold protein n=1 Tax=Helianthus annuus TaxID=4232 RepID=A0A251RZS4_HELAN|nr:uncharacterized protein LOC110915047 [Helianthus annuus]KAF5760437.1 putative universal stress protein A [Helianthus annuus]KAJ0443247.1 putative rossmann-like alpha/beta/alpha sandwich protein [Helianthus annuus]KAJ0460810.1 putative rossmann-like alpha/beta/alpha sandwich protein [Helianthus annuus]KAJ0641229.1 putative rossmann-like alpha/beta/alpha sandwich protein [Helianthus annuus]KAJ0645141.1 putative rossmann-like alpha/beta/alpha sandwich protein [Helianthus annuus]